MFNLGKFVKFTAAGTLAILMTATITVPDADANGRSNRNRNNSVTNNGNGNGNGNRNNSVTNNGNDNGNSQNAPGQNNKACKNNNGIGNNFDVEYTIGGETFSIRIDPGNQGQMNKFEGDLESLGYTEDQIDNAVSQITDAEMRHSNGNGENCPTESNVGNDYSASDNNPPAPDNNNDSSSSEETSSDGNACSAPDTVELTGIVRDFSDKHPDFQYKISKDRGIVTETIGSDRKPVYANPDGSTKTTNGKQYFDQWYRDVEGVNENKPYSITLEKQSNGNYRYENSSFFPINNELMGNEERNKNFHFTYELHGQFVYKGGEILKFSGDDDVWVYINGKRVVDLGGVHAKENAPDVNIDQKAQELGLEIGGVYDFDFFFAERHTTQSNFILETSIEFTCDQDGDGIHDSVEGTGDTDGDGTPDYQDPDTDGDGIYDNVEGTNDTDGDGTPDYKDIDSDGDTIPDSVEGSIDSSLDSDSVPNYLDLDSDGDGIPDSVEGSSDADGDDAANYLDLDSDGDGILDSTEGSSDADGDSVPNYLDLDSDGDTIPDSVEAVDNGELPASEDNLAPLPLVNTDAEDNIEGNDDDLPDYLDTNSDGDPWSDKREAGDNPSDPQDKDDNGTADYRQFDSVD